MVRVIKICHDCYIDTNIMIEEGDVIVIVKEIDCDGGKHD
jgi:hypothetical protein